MTRGLWLTLVIACAVAGILLDLERLYLVAMAVTWLGGVSVYGLWDSLQPSRGSR